MDRQVAGQTRQDVDFDALADGFRDVARDERRAVEGVQLIVVQLRVEQRDVEERRAVQDRRAHAQFVGVDGFRFEADAGRVDCQRARAACLRSGHAREDADIAGAVEVEAAGLITTRVAGVEHEVVAQFVTQRQHAGDGVFFAR